jgi:hypothetical protein
MSDDMTAGPCAGRGRCARLVRAEQGGCEVTALGSIIAFILGNKTILGIAGAVLAALGWDFHQRLAGLRPNAGSRRRPKQRPARWRTKCNPISARSRPKSQSGGWNGGQKD